MGRAPRVVKAAAPAHAREIPVETILRRRKPRSFLEWKTLRRWGKLPVWSEDPAGYLLRQLREDRGLSQRELAERLGCSQQAIAQAERWESNPTVKFMREWARALDASVAVELRSNPR